MSKRTSRPRWPAAVTGGVSVVLASLMGASPGARADDEVRPPGEVERLRDTSRRATDLLNRPEPDRVRMDAEREGRWQGRSLDERWAVESFQAPIERPYDEEPQPALGLQLLRRF